jgi:hypothetical protein
MKDSTKQMLESIDNAHDWQEGQMYSGGGSRMSSTDICRVCSLRRHYLSDEQNGIDEQYRFSDGETGADLSLRQALARGCAK